VRPLQPDDEAPAFAGAHRFAGVEPSKQDARRHCHRFTARFHVARFHIELEAHPPLQPDGQTGHDAGDLDVATFVLLRQ
jgi:hypothetical protein